MKHALKVIFPLLVLGGTSWQQASARTPAPDYYIYCDMETRRCAERTGTNWVIYGFDDRGNWWVIR